MTDFLIRHILKKVDVIIIHAHFLELLAGELGDTVVEQIQLDEFLVER